MKTTHRHHACGCCSDSVPEMVFNNGLSRRGFLFSVGAFTIGGLALTGAEAPNRRPRERRALKVQPVLTYSVPKRQEATSWREWGGIQTDAQAQAEKERIQAELAKLKETADFPIEVLGVELVRDPQKAASIAGGGHDVLLMYAAGGGGHVLEAMTRPEKWNIMFLRHEPGPVYLWYEIVHPRFLRKTVDNYGQPGFDPNDVVVDSQDELLWRLRAMSGLKNTLRKRIVAIGDAGGWGDGGEKAPAIARDLWKLDIVDFPYKDLAPKLQRAFQNQELVARCKAASAEYFKQPGVTLETTKDFADNAFVLCEVLKDVMDEAKTDAITINACMGTIMPMSKTTACLPLSLLNDDNYLAFCESDFVVIPSGILLHYISGKPVFLNDPTYPHDGMVTLAHCTAPRKMDGRNLEPARIMTHFESDYGAAPKVEMRIGQAVTNLAPDFACKKWVGFDGVIEANPFLDICRSQIDVRLHCRTSALMMEMKGFHWMTCYGSYLKETGYALKKLGVELMALS